MFEEAISIYENEQIGYICPECDWCQPITKPKPKAVKNGGVAVLTSIIKCTNPQCDSVRKVRRFPDGSYRSFKIENDKHFLEKIVKRW